MKKIIFRYSAMNAGKSANLIMNYHNYRELGLNPIALLPNLIKENKITSRLGIEITAIKITDLIEIIANTEIDCIFIDEAQFLTTKEIETLNKINIEKEITIIAYGLRTNSNGELFHGSKRLMEISDVLEELPTLCHCGNKARMNIRTIDGIVDDSDEEVKLRGTENVSYISVCRKCFYEYKTGDNKDLSSIIDEVDNTKTFKQCRKTSQSLENILKILHGEN